MQSWAAGAGVTFAISVVSAYFFLRLRCRGVGYPLGPRARWWALTIVVITAIISTGLARAAVAGSDHLRPPYIGLVIPSGLWLGKVSSSWHRRQRGTRLPGTLLACLTFPLRRLDDRMGDDMQDWCDVRSRAASRTPRLISDATEHYYLQVVYRLKDDRVRREVDRRRVSIEHKMRIVRLVSLDTTQARLQTALQRHRCTQDKRKYTADQPSVLARRLTTEAENELHLLLAYLYRLGHRKLLIYGGVHTILATPQDDPPT